MPLKIFMAGATGVIGRRAVPLLIAAGHRVTGVGRDAAKRAQLEAAGARAVAVDLFDAEAVAAAAADHDAVINLATHIPSGYRMFLPWGWRENDQIRRLAATNLAAAATGGRAAVYIQESFAPAYPDRGDGWIAEDTGLAPVSYNRSLLDAERAADSFRERGGTGVTLRFAAFYGPDAEQTQTMIAAVRRGWTPIPGAPHSYFSSVTHDDAGAAVAAALAAPAGVYNVADDEPLRRGEYVAALAEALGVLPPRPIPGWLSPLFGPLGTMIERSLRISNQKFCAATGWAPRHASAREGWPAIIASLRAAGQL